MSDPTYLTALWLDVLMRLIELSQRVDALVAVCDQYGVPRDEVERLYQDRLRQWYTTHEAELKSAVQEHSQEQIRRLLESFEGTKQ